MTNHLRNTYLALLYLLPYRRSSLPRTIIQSADTRPDNNEGSAKADTRPHFLARNKAIKPLPRTAKLPRPTYISYSHPHPTLVQTRSFTMDLVRGSKQRVAPPSLSKARLAEKTVGEKSD